MKPCLPVSGGPGGGRGGGPGFRCVLGSVTVYSIFYMGLLNGRSDSHVKGEKARRQQILSTNWYFMW